MKKTGKYVIVVSIIILLAVSLLYYTYALDEKSLLSDLDISVDLENNLTTTIIPENDEFLKNPYKGYSSEDAYNATNGTVDWRDSVDKYATEGYLKLNWYKFYKDSFVGPKDARDYKDDAYDWSPLFNLIKLYADHGMKIRFGVMTANTTSTDESVIGYKNNNGKISDWYSKTLTDLVMPKGSIIPQADYIPVISIVDNKVKLTCGNVDCSEFNDSGYDKYTHTKHVVEEDEKVYKVRNITPMWMFEGIPSGYDEDGSPLYDENAVKWYLDVNNVEWLPKWDDQNLINNIDNFVNAMANYLKNEEYNGKKLIDYISYVQVQSYGNYGENHISQTSLNSVNNEFRNPLLCGYLDTSAHNYNYAYEKDENFIYPENCYFDLDEQKVKIYNGVNWHFSYIDTIKYYTNVSFEFFREKYLKTYINAFEDTDVRLVFNWYSGWDYDYYYDKEYVSNNTIKEILEEYKDYLTIRTDSVFGTNFGEGEQLAQANGIVPTSFEYMFARYEKEYDGDNYFSKLKQKILENNLCTNKFDCVTDFFVYVVENSRATYMDYNYVLYDYYENYIEGKENDYTLDLDYLGNSLGYHFILKEAKYNTKVDLSETDNNLNVDLKVVNDGVTYLYDNDDTKVYLALLETDGNGNVIVDSNNKSVVSSKFITNIDPTTWKSSMDITGNRDSSDEDNWISESINLNVNNVDSGKYILALGMFTDFDENYPTIKLGNKGATLDNWYVLGEVELEASSYNIKYDSNGGIGLMDSLTAKYGDQLELLKNTFTRKGFVFNSWNTASDRSGKSYKDEESVIDIAGSEKEITLYAMWDIIDYNIIYDSNGGNDILDGDYRYNIETTKIKLPTIPEREGYEFIGWKLVECNGEWQQNNIYNEQTIEVKDIGNIKLVAQWSLLKVIVNNYDNDGKKISNIVNNTTIDKYLDSFDISSNISIKVYNDLGDEVNNSNLIATGFITKLFYNDKLLNEYVNVVSGDVTGDGRVDINDLNNLYNHYLKNIQLKDDYLKAADVTLNNNVDLGDLAKMYNYNLGKIKDI